MRKPLASLIAFLALFTLISSADARTAKATSSALGRQKATDEEDRWWEWARPKQTDTITWKSGDHQLDGRNFPQVSVLTEGKWGWSPGPRGIALTGFARNAQAVNVHRVDGPGPCGSKALTKGWGSSTSQRGIYAQWIDIWVIHWWVEATGQLGNVVGCAPKVWDSLVRGEDPMTLTRSDLAEADITESTDLDAGGIIVRVHVDSEAGDAEAEPLIHEEQT
jgi:hypothetical protein